MLSIGGLLGPNAPHPDAMNMHLEETSIFFEVVILNESLISKILSTF